MKTVAICIATYKRPRGLERLLRSLFELQLQEHPDAAIQIIVVDNDKFRTAEEVANQSRVLSPWPLIYDVEPKRGISHARNRLVNLAKRNQFVAFIDDDEIAHPLWLDELLSAHDRFGAQIVTGPVIPRFESDPPNWILKGRFFERKQYRDGQWIECTGTGNVLIATSEFEDRANPFDPRLALSGGSDTLFFLRLTRRGTRIAFTTKAIVEELVPASRTSVAWLCKRAYRAGNTYNICKHILEDSKTWIPIRGLKGFARITVGAIGLFAALPLGRIAFVKALTGMSKGAGGLAGILGKKYLEYEKIHGA